MSEEINIEVAETSEISLIFEVCSNCGVVSSPQKWEYKEVTYNGQKFEGALCPVCKSFCMRDSEIYNELIEEDSADLPEACEMRTVTPIFTVDELNELDTIKKELAALKKKDEAKSPKIKNFLIENNIKEFEFYGHKMVITHQNRGKMDEDKLADVIRSKCTPEQIEHFGLLKEIADPEALKEAISNGLISMEDLSACMIPNMIPMFSLNPKSRRGKGAKSPESGFGGNF